MKNDKYYWAIFIIVAILVGMAFLMAGGIFNRDGEMNGFNIAKKNITSQKANDSNNQKTVTEKDNIEQLKEANLADTNIDIEADKADFSNDSLDDVKDLDENLDLSSADTEVY